MARIRTIKPKFWDDLKIGKLSRDARLLYIGMWNFADDCGVVIGSAIWLKSKVFPYDQLQMQQFEKWIKELEINGFIYLFSYMNEEFIYLPTFSRHQVINKPNFEDLNIPKTVLDKLLKESGNQSRINHGIITEQSVPIEEEEIEKENNTKENSLKLEQDDEFNRFWNMYDYKKGDKTKVKKKFLSLSRADREKIFETLPLYIESTPDKQYRKHPQTYLNNRSWEDEILQRNTHQSTPIANLGVGEFINTQGQRTYGSGKYIIPMDAPPRPGQNYYFDASTQKWML